MSEINPNGNNDIHRDRVDSNESPIENLDLELDEVLKMISKGLSNKYQTTLKFQIGNQLDLSSEDHVDICSSNESDLSMNSEKS